ncbi:ATP-dependent RNA helicase vasa-like [Solenopsis invicta]|uniref:ATP-dependent RNA helicase vasa-like n=1 Tax=Solenopsis invicta TaxID=13686 RepID=UPI00193C8DAD|nr:ATP-dependent RNA helicase vasa-like [Solenopsis invicta]
MDGEDDGKVGEMGGEARGEDGGENETDYGGARGGEKERGGVEEREREDGEKSRRLREKLEEGMRLGGGGKGVGDLERRVGKLEESGRGGGEGGGGDGGLEKRVRKMEEMWEERDRKERKRRVVIKGYKAEGKDVKCKVEEILKRVGAEVKVEEVREVKTGREEQGGFAVVSFRTEGEKREVMKKKGGLRGDKVWIEDDLTWKERQVRWRIREMAREEERRGARV